MKGLAVCDTCYPKIQSGIKFIQDRLNYSIGEIKSSLNFWLIPHLNDQRIIIQFQNDLGNKNLYLNSLKELCSALKTISIEDRHESFHETINVESFLSFSALFYTFEGGWMRIFNYKQGIYPSHLQKLFEVKEKVDNQYPFRIISKNFKEKEGAFFVGFPLLIMFYKGIMPQWQIQVIAILDKILTGQQVIVDQVIQNIIIKIREVSLKSYDLKRLTRTIFLGLLLLEYLINLNGSQKNKDLPQPGDKSITKDLRQDIANIQKFIETHNNILFDGTTRAIFAVGVCVGILIEVQNELYKKKMAPFWSRLSRLDLDFERIKLLPREVKSKLAIYNERRYNTIISYLEANEFSDINICSPNISRENLNLIFSIGLSYGYLLKNQLLK
jgi:CRISPR-associated protein Cas8b/Csh1 subtype I-B